MRVVLELEILFKTQSVPCSEMILWTSARSLASMALKNILLVLLLVRRRMIVFVVLRR
jgi:hypothetical protein